MNKKRFLFILIAIAALLGSIPVVSVALAASNATPARALIQVVRDSTAKFKDVKVAEAAGYGIFHGCVSGPDHGAMGVHFVNGALVGDGKLDASKPEALLYEFKNGKYSLLGVEYVVDADTWNKANNMPPVLDGQLFNYSTAPNRYGIPAPYYYLHVWAWRNNPSGAFSDWNNNVSCDQFTSDQLTMPGMDH